MYSRAVIRIIGLVQGVGYRYFACQAAQALSLTGTVRNQDDGSVEVIVEGSKSMILELIRELERGHRFSHVSSVQVQWEAYRASFKTFSILH